MKDYIKEHLKRIEQEKNITILFACETGSRAWGFPSPDSDYDIRVIYKHTIDWYLSLTEKKDTIEMMLDDNNLDISGWDLRKTLRLLSKSNPPLLERIQSPMIYMANDNFLADINAIAGNYYSRIATIHHYLSMAKKCLDEIEGKSEYRLKKLFYALRTAAVCRWILDNEKIPSIEFESVLNGIHLDNEVKKRIGELILLKATKNESYLHSGEENLIAFIKMVIDQSEKEAQSLPLSKGSMKELNQFFRRWVK